MFALKAYRFGNLFEADVPQEPSAPARKGTYGYCLYGDSPARKQLTFRGFIPLDFSTTV